MADLGLIRQDRDQRRAGRYQAVRRPLMMAAKGVAATVGAGVVVCGVALLLAWRRDRAMVALLENPTDYQAAAIDLVRLCQTDPKLLHQQNGSVALERVASVGRLRPDADGLFVHQPDFASVTWSPGIQYGWRLDRLPDRRGQVGTHPWTLSSWYSEDSGPHVLQTFDMPADARFTAAGRGWASARHAGR